MTTALLRVPKQPPVPSPQDWLASQLGIAVGWPGNNRNGAYYNGHTYIGFCDGEGNARVAAYNHSTGKFTLSPVIVSGLGADCHCGPSVLVRSSDHKIVIAVAPHAAAHLYVAVSTNAEDISAWGAATDIVSTLGATSCTYANLFQLSGESGKIYLFYRQGSSGGGQLCYSTSTNGGVTWSAQTVLYQNTGHGCYWAISSDDTSRIDFLVSDGNPADDVTLGSAYHFYYSGGSFAKSDGTTISVSKPYAPTNLTKIYDGATNGYVRAPFDIVTNGGNPIAVWAAWNIAGSGSNENYWSGFCSAGSWTVNQITDSGGPVDGAFSEGGVCVDHTTPTRVFVSKKTSGVWQIFSYSTSNSGSTWTSSQLTSDTAAAGGDAYNLRPISPRNADAALSVFWAFGPHYGVAGGGEVPAAQIRCYPNPIKVF